MNNQFPILPKKWSKTWFSLLISFSTESKLKKMFRSCWLEGSSSWYPEYRWSSEFISFRMFRQLWICIEIELSERYFALPSVPNSYSISISSDIISLCLFSILSNIASAFVWLWLTTGASCWKLLIMMWFSLRSTSYYFISMHCIISSLSLSAKTFFHSSKASPMVFVELSY